MNWTETEFHRLRDHRSESRIFARRVVVTLVGVIVLFGVLLFRFYRLQVVDHESYATLSDNNRIHVRPLSPNRGLIYDRNGLLVADNRPSYTLSIIKERTKDLESLLTKIASRIQLTPSQRKNFFKLLKRRRRPFEAVPLRYRLTEDEIAKIAVDEYLLEGVEIEAQLVRDYPYQSLFAHSVGYVGRINERELNKFDEEAHKRYSGTHSIGKIGLERFYEDALLGTVGHEYIETNAHGRVLRTIEEHKPQPGSDLHLFLDMQLQLVAANAIGNRRGAAVAIDVNTGGILAMVSAPSYDPNLFVTGISFKNYRGLNESKDLPLFNRTIQAQYSPGSTIKPFLGLGALEYGIVKPGQRVRDPGYYQLKNDDRLYRDWKKGGHGHSVNLREAIIQSCDTYYFDTGFRMGVDRMHEFGLKFGLGKKTGIDIPSERQGIWPSRAWKRGYQGLAWYPGDSLNMSIGQGYVLSTPLQLAVMTTVMANRGTLIQPRLVARINDEPVLPRIISQHEGDASHWDLVQSAMEGVIHHSRGTARKVGLGAKYRMAGKSGTVQVVSIAQDAEYDSDKLAEHHRDHALFVAYAPAKQPKIAVSVIIENGEGGSSVAAPVVRKIIDAYMDAQGVLQ